MTVDYLINFAESISQDSFLYKLSEENQRQDAYWILEGDLKLIVNYQNEWWGITEKNCKVSFAQQDNVWDLLAGTQCIPLTKHNIKSYPSLDYVFYFGDLQISTWLAENNWQKDWGFNDNFKDPVGQDYVNWWMDNYPLYFDEDNFIIEGGWSMIWPDDNEPLQYDGSNEFLFCTIFGGEPYYEVYRYRDTGKFTTYFRIT
ncbi:MULTISPECIES: hypothetical protein [unclassified Spirosoma]|uniref:hypothetical protein n=1 Tax=unclassified Spirosoma TaxID=2621999 RepID=UPI000967703F|nr:MULTISPECIES: hypothetical protein [unclassified Spirosoma]MBN8820838.1 hypothetical protein [Spirosoma sp.]OJW75766.1 MAG: hypothetical protein BGO59_04575 [Spirosoma sp. 48-14]